MNRQENILVCFALKEEAAPFQKLTVGTEGISARLTGIGRVNAEKTIRECLAARSPGLVLTCGFAGGLNPKLQIGDVVFRTVDPELDARLASAGAKPGSFYCASRIAVTKAEKQALRQSSGADAVEMESEAIQAVCRERGVRCATVRAISDTADDDLPLDFNQLSKPDMSLDFGKLAIAILGRPGKVPSLMRLQKNCRTAAERLAAVLVKVIQRR